MPTPTDPTSAAGLFWAALQHVSALAAAGPDLPPGQHAHQLAAIAAYSADVLSRGSLLIGQAERTDQ